MKTKYEQLPKDVEKAIIRLLNNGSEVLIKSIKGQIQVLEQQRKIVLKSE